MDTSLLKFDHVHVHVRDREASARWFERVLGLRASEAFAHWALTPGGPLLLETPGGQSCLSLFEGEPDAGGDHTIAFATDADGFLAFLRGLDQMDLTDHRGDRVEASRVVDHKPALSIYFSDPDGNRFELICYDYGAVSAQLPIAR